MSAVVVLAGLAWRRLWRGRSLYITAILAALALALALLLPRRIDVAERWEALATFWLSFLVTVGAAVHLASAVGEEIETRTFTYLWSRPVPRTAVLLGKLLAVVPVLAGASLLVLPAAYVLVTGAEAGAHVDWLVRGVAGAIAGTVAASAFAVGAGAIFPRHPFLFTLGYLLAAEQFLWRIPNVANVSFLYHARIVAGLDPGGVGGALLGLALLTAFWLALGLWRVSTADYGAEDR